VNDEQVRRIEGPDSAPPPHATTSGHAVSAAGWLDAHFEACRPEYEAILRSVGIEPGWRVLDAGCGGGNFLPLLAGLVGPGGTVAAVDLAPDNVEAVRARLGSLDLPCPVTVEVGSLLRLPFPDAHFDAAWCANVLMYLDDAELLAALAELRRVVRPGGLIAAKEQDLGLGRLHPAPAALSWRLTEAVGAVEGYIAGGLRSCALRVWMARAGLADVRQRAALIERWAPLRPVERQFLAQALDLWAGAAARYGTPPADQAAWRRLADPASADYLLDQPDLYFSEGHVVATARVPDAAA
jgi:SAM-dependent methyltransferase